MDVPRADGIEGGRKASQAFQIDVAEPRRAEVLVAMHVEDPVSRFEAVLHCCPNCGAPDACSDLRIVKVPVIRERQICDCQGQPKGWRRWTGATE
jgi:hypothetical protein